MGGFPDLDLSFLFCPFWDFPGFSGIFPICSGMVRGFSRFALFLFLGLLRAPTRNSPERVRDTVRTFPEKKWETPGFGNTPVKLLSSKVCSQSLYLEICLQLHAAFVSGSSVFLLGWRSTWKASWKNQHKSSCF